MYIYIYTKVGLRTFKEILYIMRVAYIHSMHYLKGYSETLTL